MNTQEISSDTRMLCLLSLRMCNTFRRVAVHEAAVVNNILFINNIKNVTPSDSGFSCA